ncbi:hypothetical protein GCM10009837_42700 [Streptomyces durmitorensis]|uniref:CBS domain-containing protein n=1 Tax=Streptomyces durmitorensis TaxID=319947 RepID=A0ABY4Q4S1_9ACTN|nr:CBS domain-containing protein [Streptomyces durmitorensis]UQT60712.1 CBS domain-containing protein [Streptomyces durmitorensis]
MKHNKAGSVMAMEVVRALHSTPFQEVAGLLVEHHISGLPVVDEDEKVIGVISETDLMVRREHTPDPARSKRRFRLTGLTRGTRRQAPKTHARTAGQLMSVPPVTVRADNTIAEVARTMTQSGAERLPVVDVGNRLVGIVTRRDLIRVFLQPDDEIRRREVIEKLTYRLDDSHLRPDEPRRV